MKNSTRSQNLCEQILRRKNLTDKYAKQLIRSDPEQFYQLYKVQYRYESAQQYIVQYSAEYSAHSSSEFLQESYRADGSYKQYSGISVNLGKYSSPRGADAYYSQNYARSRDIPSLLQRSSENMPAWELLKSGQEIKIGYTGKSGFRTEGNAQRSEKDRYANRSGLLDSMKANGPLSEPACLKSASKQALERDLKYSEVELPNFAIKTEIEPRNVLQNALYSQQQGNYGDNALLDQSSDGDFLGFIDGNAADVNYVCTGSYVYFFGEEQQERGLAYNLAEFFTANVEINGRYTPGSRYSRKPPSAFDGQIVSNLPRKSRKLPDRQPYRYY